MSPRAGVDAFQQRNVSCLNMKSDWQALTVLCFCQKGKYDPWTLTIKWNNILPTVFGGWLCLSLQVRNKLNVQYWWPLILGFSCCCMSKMAELNQIYYNLLIV